MRLPTFSLVLLVAAVPCGSVEDREPQVMIWTDCEGNELVTSANYAYWWINRYAGRERCRWHYFPWLELRQKGAASELRYWLPRTEERWRSEGPMPTDGGWEATEERHWACEWCD